MSACRIRSPNQYSRLPLGAVFLQHGERAGYLRAAALDPERRDLLVELLLVEQADALVGETRGEPGDLERAMPVGLLGGIERALWGHQAFQMGEDQMAVDEHVLVVEDQHRHAHQRVRTA